MQSKEQKPSPLDSTLKKGMLVAVVYNDAAKSTMRGQVMDWGDVHLSLNAVEERKQVVIPWTSVHHVEMLK